MKGRLKIYEPEDKSIDFSRTDDSYVQGLQIDNNKSLYQYKIPLTASVMAL